MVLAPHGLREAKQSAADVCPREAPGGNEQGGGGMSELFAIMLLHPESEACGVDVATFAEELAHHSWRLFLSSQPQRHQRNREHRTLGRVAPHQDTALVNEHTGGA